MKESRFPKWLNLAAGYGASGMVYARENENNLNGYESYRQYYLGIDFDFSYIETNKAWLKAILYLADMIKWLHPPLKSIKTVFKDTFFTISQIFKSHNFQAVKENTHKECTLAPDIGYPIAM